MHAKPFNAKGFKCRSIQLQISQFSGVVSWFMACADNDEVQRKRVKQCVYARHGHIFGPPTVMVRNLGLTHLVEERMTRRRLWMTEATISATVERPVKDSFVHTIVPHQYLWDICHVLVPFMAVPATTPCNA